MRLQRSLRSLINSQHAAALWAALALPILLTAQQAHVNLEHNPQKNSDNLVPYGASVISPEVHADQTVTFRVRAPRATEIALALGPLVTALDKPGKPIPFTKQEDGLWTLTVGPVKPNIYVYKLLIDGVSVADPNNTVAGNSDQPPYSQVVVAGSEPAYYDARPVPHGTVTRHIYHSNVTKGEREMYVYTPPGYNRSRKYPVLYLVGGSGELASNWAIEGRVNFILDNLLAERKAVPMIIAMPNNQVVHRSHPKHIEMTFPLFEAELRQHIVPLVEERYSVQRDRRSRALAGLSMGGRHTELVGFRCVDLFSSFGILSAGDLEPAKSNPEFFNDPQVSKKVDYLLVGLGTKEEIKPNAAATPAAANTTAPGPRGSIGQRSLSLHEALTQHKIPHDYYVGGDGAHDWGTWRHLVYARLLPNLWRKQ